MKKNWGIEEKIKERKMKYMMEKKSEKFKRKPEKRDGRELNERTTFLKIHPNNNHIYQPLRSGKVNF